MQSRNGYHGDSCEAMVRHAMDVTERTGERLADSMVDHGQRRIEQNTPVATRLLRESWERTGIEYGQVATLGYTSIRWASYAWTGRVYTMVEYAAFVEYGTGLWGPKRKKYKIQPKRPDGVLAFTPYARVPGGGVVLDVAGEVGKQGTVVVRFVMHPGSPGAHMIKIGSILTEHEYRQWSEEPMRLWKHEIENGKIGAEVKVGA
jgi:hypothetical protein